MPALLDLPFKYIGYVLIEVSSDSPVVFADGCMLHKKFRIQGSIKNSLNLDT